MSERYLFANVATPSSFTQVKKRWRRMLSLIVETSAKRESQEFHLPCSAFFPLDGFIRKILPVASSTRLELK